MADIESLELKIKGNASGATKSLNTLISTLEKLERVTAGGCGLSAVTKEVDKLNKVADAMDRLKTATNGLGKLKNVNLGLSASNSTSAQSFTNLATKAVTAGYALKKVGSTIASWINESNDYVENLNLFTVSMGEYAGAAQEYAENVGELLGIDPSTWMRNQGVFMTLATGFGVASDRAATMSQQLTQLGYDISSFYNVSVEDAMQKLQSGISGELEPLRRLGYDLSQAKLEATALSLGIDKAVSSMTQAEKAELRYYAIMTQVTQAQGDMARTLDAPANQLRILKAQVDQAARALGNIFIPALNAILPYVIAAVKVIRVLANAVATLFNFTLPEVDYSSASNVGSDIADGLEDANKEATKLKRTLLGIDELNVLGDTSASTSADYSGGGFDFELPTYDFIGEATNNRVNEIVESMKEWLGIGGEINSWSDLLDTRFGSILKTVGLIGLEIALWKVTTSFMSAVATLKTLLSNPSYSIAIGVALTITGIVLAFDSMGDAIKNGLDGFNFAGIISNSLLGVGGAAFLGTKIATWITTAFSGSAVANALTAATINLFGEAAGPVTTAAVATTGGILAAAVTGIILGIPMYLVGIYDAVKNGIDWLSAALIPLGATAAAAGIGAIIGMLGGPIGAGVGALIGLAIGLLTDFGIWLWQNFDEIEAWFADLPGWAKVAVTGVVAAVMIGLTTITGGWAAVTVGIVALITGVITFLKHWEDVKQFFSGIATWFYDHVVAPIVDFFSPFGLALLDLIAVIYNEVSGTVRGIIVAVGSIVSKVTEIALKIVEIAVALGKAAYTYVIKPLVDCIAGAAEWIYNTFVAPLLNVLSAIGNAINTCFIQPIYDGIVWVRDIAVTLFKSIGETAVTFVSNLFKNTINSVFTIIENKINGFIRLLNGAIDIINKIPGVKITKVAELSIPRLANGGMVDSGQMFIAREAGPELVSNVGHRTAVMNNDQIVESVSQGVYRAVVQAMGQSGGNQVVEAKVNDKVLFEVVVNRNRQETIRTGYSPLLGGV